MRHLPREPQTQGVGEEPVRDSFRTRGGKMTLAAWGEDTAQEKALRAEGKKFKNFQLFNLLSQKTYFCGS